MFREIWGRRKKTLYEGILSLAQSPSNDVDRAMAAFAAAPMPYRNFAASTIGSPNVTQAGTPTAATEQQIGAAPTVAFSLLMAALPDIFQFPVQVAALPKTDNSFAAALEEPKSEPTTAGTGLSDMPRERSSDPVLVPERSLIVPKLPSQASLLVPPTATTRTLKHYPSAPSTARSHTMPLATMFRALGDAAPSRDEQAKPQTGLQNMFSRL